LRAACHESQRIGWTVALWFLLKRKFQLFLRCVPTAQPFVLPSYRETQYQS